MEKVSSNFSLTTLLVRVTKGGRRPRLSFYAPELTTVFELRVRYLGSRISTRQEREVIRNYHPDIILDKEKKQAFANFAGLRTSDRFRTPRPVLVGPEYRKPIVGFRYTVRYHDDEGQTKRARLLYEFFDKRGLARFRHLMRSGRLPIPLTGNQVNFGIEPWNYRVRTFETKKHLGGGS